MKVIQETIPMLEETMRKMTQEYNYLVDQLATCEQIQSMTFKELEVVTSTHAREKLQAAIRNQILQLQEPGEVSNQYLDDSDLKRCKHVIEKMGSLFPNVRAEETPQEIIGENLTNDTKSTEKNFFDQIIDKVKNIFL